MSNIKLSGDPRVAYQPILARSGQSSQEFQEFSGEGAIATAPCPHCEHIGVSRVQMPQYCDRRTALRCGRCDTFRCWLEQPAKQRGKRSLSAQQQKTFRAGMGGGAK